ARRRPRAATAAPLPSAGIPWMGSGPVTMDRRTLVAIALCLLVLIAWPFVLKWLGLEHYVRAPQPRAPVSATDTTSRGVAERTPEATMRTPAAAGGAQPATPVLAQAPFTPVTAELERTIMVETPLYHAQFSSRGARLVSVELKRYATAHGVSSVGGR